MRILIVAPELVPYAKVGGLGDVVGALAESFAKRGHDVVAILPCYKSIDLAEHGFEPHLGPLGVAFDDETLWAGVHGLHAGAGHRVFLIDRQDLFDRAAIYGFSDDVRRFAFFSKAALQLCRDLAFVPDVVHCHDWATALVPALLKFNCRFDYHLGQTGSLLTIHNLAHQQKSDPSVLRWVGLPSAVFVPAMFEDFGLANVLKGGIACADLLNTVSPNYAREIMTTEGGAGLDQHLRYRYADLHGILNGVDYRIWNPEHDPHIAASFSTDEMSGKRDCKLALQREMGLATEAKTPVFGVVARLVQQKGLDLVAKIVDAMVADGAQLALLGSGDLLLETVFADAMRKYPGRVGTFIGYSDGLAHRIEAGADFFLMPSRFEPCGLNQIYSMRYGTLPIVRNTGGLHDTVIENLEIDGDGTGFCFDPISASALWDAICRALVVYREHGALFGQLRRNAMARRFDWQSATAQYLQLFDWAHHKRSLWREP